MYACTSTLIVTAGSSTLSFTGMGTLSSSVVSSSSSLVEPSEKMSMQARKISQGRTLTGTDFNSIESAKTLHNSSVDIVERRCWLLTTMELYAT